MSPGPLYSRARRDLAEPEVVEVFREAGAVVVKHSGKDEPDLFVCYLGRWFAVEVKTGRAALRPGQARFASGVPVSVARTATHARKLVRQWETASAVENAPYRNVVRLAGGGVDAAMEDHLDGPEVTTAGKDWEAPA